MRAKIKDGCWEWTGPKRRGYGVFGSDKKVHIAHRKSFELFIGPIAKGLVIDHLCRNKACINPLHLEVVTNKENVLRGVGPSAKNASKKYCKNGHQLTKENIQNVVNRYERRCKICANEYQNLRRARIRNSAPFISEASDDK